MAGWSETLRSGAWLTRERVRLVALALLVASVIGAGFLIATSDGLNDRFGRPLGTDFSNVYAAGTYVLDGNAAAPFDPRLQYAREQAIFGAKTRILRLALSAVLPRARRAAGADALCAGARPVAGRDAHSLSAGDARDPLSRVMAGLDPAIHVFLSRPAARRGCPAQRRAKRRRPPDVYGWA